MSIKQKLLLPSNHVGALWFYDQRPFPMRPHQHDELECNLVVRGHGTYLINGRMIEIASRSILWLFPAQDHILLEQSSDFAMWILLIKPNYLRQICTDQQSATLLADNPTGNFCRHLPERQAKNLWEECKRISEIAEQESFYNISLGYLLHSAWAVSRQSHITTWGESVHPAVEKAARLINDGIEQDDLASLALQVGLSTHRLSRLFKQQIAMSLTDFRNNCRLERFLELYQYGQTKTMLDAALQAGFGSYAQFYRVFKQITGMTPASFDRSLKQITGMTPASFDRSLKQITGMTPANFDRSLKQKEHHKVSSQ